MLRFSVRDWSQRWKLFMTLLIIITWFSSTIWSFIHFLISQIASLFQSNIRERLSQWVMTIVLQCKFLRIKCVTLEWLAQSLVTKITRMAKVVSPLVCSVFTVASMYAGVMMYKMKLYKKLTQRWNSCQCFCSPPNPDYLLFKTVSFSSGWPHFPIGSICQFSL